MSTVTAPQTVGQITATILNTRVVVQLPVLRLISTPIVINAKTINVPLIRVQGDPQ